MSGVEEYVQEQYRKTLLEVASKLEAGMFSNRDNDNTSFKHMAYLSVCAAKALLEEVDNAAR